MLVIAEADEGAAIVFRFHGKGPGIGSHGQRQHIVLKLPGIGLTVESTADRGDRACRRIRTPAKRGLCRTKICALTGEGIRRVKGQRRHLQTRPEARESPRGRSTQIFVRITFHRRTNGPAIIRQHDISHRHADSGKGLGSVLCVRSRRNADRERQCVRGVPFDFRDGQRGQRIGISGLDAKQTNGMTARRIGICRIARVGTERFGKDRVRRRRADQDNCR